MQFTESRPLRDVRLVRLKRVADARGTFVKTYGRTLFNDAGATFDIAEEYYSVSQMDVIRGMHFQVPPYDHQKIVYCAAGVVEDVLLDLRKGPGYGCFASIRLDAGEPNLLVIPKGVAHGFKALTNQSLMVYKTSTEHAPKYDRGIRWDSFGFDWRCSSPIISERDTQHPTLADFQSPFAQ